MTSQSEPELFREICSRAKRIEQLYVFLPVCWRKSKFMIFDLKNAAQYNGTECIAKGVDPGSGRIMTRLLNQDQNELLIKHENLQLVNLNLDEKSEPVLCKAKERLSVSSSTSVPMTREGLASSIVNLTQGLLDVTFAIENNMVDDDFSNKSLFREILSTLKGVEDLCLKYCACFGDKPSNGTEAMKEVLGDGMAECVHWRRGALAYMFTAVEANFQHELELSLIEEGLEQFESMLGTRGKKYQEDADDCEGNEDVREMLKNSAGP
uniref:Uncharacterized protein n=1 Tax=Guillardia theta TaxID=55529 RepID=A0A7S4JTF2_GUITH|mmetsp:Transcript_18587/g.61048  ORF Transcript_18587/g.61048 Transcript_18587/m.61048 type:complete len:266 (+) Transcript_18587:190-987(+)